MKRTHVFPYHDADKTLAFAKVRYRTSDERGKTFRYFKPDGTPGKPQGADALLYRLPQVLRERRSGADLFWCEGERDADAVLDSGYVATSHHQAAGHATAGQAEWVQGWSGHIYIVADRDIPGAVCAVRRYDLLRGAGASRTQVTIVRARHGKDARDHIEAGLSVARFVPLSLSKLRRIVEEKSQRDRWAATKSLSGPGGFKNLLVGRPSGDEWRAFCPAHENPATSRTPSASVNFATGVWFCHACGAGGRVPDRSTDRLPMPSWVGA